MVYVTDLIHCCIFKVIRLLFRSSIRNFAILGNITCKSYVMMQNQSKLVRVMMDAKSTFTYSVTQNCEVFYYGFEKKAGVFNKAAMDKISNVHINPEPPNQ